MLDSFLTEDAEQITEGRAVVVKESLLVGEGLAWRVIKVGVVVGAENPFVPGDTGLDAIAAS